MDQPFLKKLLFQNLNLKMSVGKTVLLRSCMFLHIPELLLLCTYLFTFAVYHRHCFVNHSSWPESFLWFSVYCKSCSGFWELFASSDRGQHWVSVLDVFQFRQPVAPIQDFGLLWVVRAHHRSRQGGVQLFLGLPLREWEYLKAKKSMSNWALD